MNGIICVNKPGGVTSFDVVAKLRSILKIKKIGHGGTLDPIAEGVLPVFLGNATKACDIIPDKTKSYTAGFRLGETSDTQDITGNIVKRSETGVPESDLLAVMTEFTGIIRQIPPMYSAVKVGGKRLYELARKGIEAERDARETEIMSIELRRYDPETREGIIDVTCSRGTYIRTLINDIGERLGCGGIMTSLLRTASGGFTLDESHTPGEIQQAADEGRIDDLIIPVQRPFADMPPIRLDESQTEKYRHGVKLDLSEVSGFMNDITEYAVYGNKSEFIGTAFADIEGGVLKIGKNLA